jgi:hypothetical protein
VARKNQPHNEAYANTAAAALFPDQAAIRPTARTTPAQITALTIGELMLHIVSHIADYRTNR